MRRAPPVIQQFNNDLDTKFKEFQGEIDNKTNILFKVSMKSCGACKSKTYLDSFALLKKKYDTSIKFVELDVEKDRSLLAMLDILENSVPYIKLFIKGKLINTYTGVSVFKKLDEDIKKTLI
jgi:thioredoxin-like negative regulator of GroEL